MYVKEKHDKLCVAARHLFCCRHNVRILVFSVVMKIVGNLFRLKIAKERKHQRREKESLTIILLLRN